MLSPIGNLPPAVYWRRRLAVALVPLVLVLVIAWTQLDGGGNASKTATPVSSTRSASTSAPPTGPTRPTTRSKKKSKPAGGRLIPPGKQCRADELDVVAATGRKAYPVRSQPELFLQVTNIARTPCQQDLADSQIEFRIYVGDVRFWGSHDCVTEPGVDVQTLVPARPVKRQLTWSGQTSTPGCAGARLGAQAGQYMLSVILAKKASVPVPFRLTGAG